MFPTLPRRTWLHMETTQMASPVMLPSGAVAEVAISADAVLRPSTLPRRNKPLAM